MTTSDLVMRTTPRTGRAHAILPNDSARLTLIGPDLKLELLSNWLTPTPPVLGQAATIRFRVRNVGQKPALDFTVQLYLDGVLARNWEFDHIDPKEDSAHQYHPLLPGQATRSFEYTTQPLSATHTLRWVVDAGNEVTEQDEQKNSLEALLAPIASSYLPDLVPEILSPTGAVEIGQTATLRIKITNKGATDVLQPFWIFAKSNGKHIITKELQPLKSYSSILIERPISSVSEKLRRIDVEVDPYNEVNERNKSNNTCTRERSSWFGR